MIDIQVLREHSLSSVLLFSEDASKLEDKKIEVETEEGTFGAFKDESTSETIWSFIFTHFTYHI